MGLFDRKKTDDPASQPEPMAFSPEKAKRFFEHARTVHDTENFEYAVGSWLQGMRLDPMAVDGLLGFFTSLDKFLEAGGAKKGLSKDVLKPISANSDLDKYLRSLVEWGQKPSDATLAMRAFELSTKLGLTDPARWIGERALGWVRADKKPRKDHYVKACECFEKLGVFDKAIIAAEEAVKLDPSDGPLAAKVRQLAAQATMTKGGYEAAAGQGGGFRSSIRDASKQQMLEAQDRVVQTADSLARLVDAAEKEAAARPGDLPTMERLAKVLAQRGTGDDEERAIGILTQMHVDSGQFRFREMAGEIRLRQLRRRVGEAKQKLDERPGEADRAAVLVAARKALSEQECAELQLRVDAYPTDLGKKFDLGSALFRAERFEDSIPLFQEAQGDPRFRTKAQAYLAESFYRMQWLDEAIQSYRSALESRDLTPEQQIDIQYGLMRALQGKGEAERDLPSAEEAEKIASGIAIKNLNFRDIRGRREALKKLVQALRMGGGAPAPGTQPA